MYRLGFTETTLLFYFYLDNILKLNIKEIYISKELLINWLYSTSGFYDKQIKGEYFNFNENECSTSIVYNTYMNTILRKIKNYDNETILCFHNLPNTLLPYKEQFLQYINHKPFHRNIHNHIFNFMNSKNVLIVHNLSELFKNQYESGNLKLIYPDLPYIKNIYTYLPGYTFCNNGPDNSILDTATNHCIKIGEIIDNNEIDCVIISCGAYSVLLADYVHFKKGKEVIVSGGELPNYFGVITKRSPARSNETKHLWIPVPEKLRPPNYEKIEGGCYW